MNIGHNSDSGKQLQSFVERVEAIRAAKQTMADDESAVMAEAKLNGFIPKAIRHVIKIRAMKPHERQESEAIVDTYLHALGMATDTPLFRQIGLMGVDIAARDQVTEALKSLVPENGSIIIETGGQAVKLIRGDNGQVEAHAHDPNALAPTPRGGNGGGRGPGPRMPPKDPPPDTDDHGAEELGREAFRGNQPIIANPFPFGDSRRGCWDLGWRKESGSDGMGPDD